MSTLLLALGASVSWGLSDFLAGARVRTLALPVVLGASQLSGLALLIVVLVVRGRDDALPAALTAPSLILASAAGVAGVTSLGLLYCAMARGGVSWVAPISAGGAAVPVVVGVWRGEPLSAHLGAGIVLALVGMLTAGATSEPTNVVAGVVAGAAHAPRVPSRAVNPALLVGIPSALLGGIFFTILRDASVEHVFAATFVNRLMACLLVTAWAFGRREVFAARPWPPLPALVMVAVVGVADAVAELSFASASSRGALSIVTPLSSLSPAVAVLLAVTLLRERLRGLHAAGVACSLAGVLLLGSG